MAALTTTVTDDDSVTPTWSVAITVKLRFIAAAVVATLTMPSLPMVTPSTIGERLKVLVPVPPVATKAVELSARPDVVVMDCAPDKVIAGFTTMVMVVED